jgi:hypothetical protein
MDYRIQDSTADFNQPLSDAIRDCHPSTIIIVWKTETVSLRLFVRTSCAP